MPKTTRFECEYCGKKGFKSQPSLHQHQTQTDACFAKLTSSLGSQYNEADRSNNHIGAAKHLPFASVNPHKRPSIFNRLIGRPQKSQKLRANTHAEYPTPDFGQPLNYDDYDNDFDMLLGHTNNNDDLLEDASEQIDDSMRQNFLDYVEGSRDFIPFTHQETTAINLLIQCRKTKASLGTYESMYHWHLESNGVLNRIESLKNSPDFLAKEKVYDMLRERYNMEEGYINQTTIVLPSTKAEAKIVWNDAKMVVQSLLVEPRATPED